MVRRDAFVKIVRERLPEVYYIAWQRLYFDEHVLHSVMGVQQGDPLGPSLVSLAIDEVIRSVATVVL